MSVREIFGESSIVKDMTLLIDKVANVKTNVLIIGESGTGKELVARRLHEMGPLKGKPFVPVNCGAIPENLIESELFGHKKGSFTGAVSDKVGLFESANGGSLFLDEVGELPLQMQVKLLRALQERIIRRVGGNDDIKIDVRIIAATNRNLEEAIKKGQFREDLYYRLNVILIKTPPLRLRGNDVELLANLFLDKFCEKQKKSKFELSSEFVQFLKLYQWPGNVRELENLMERAVTLVSGELITNEVLPPHMLAILEKNQGDSTNLKIDGFVLPSLRLGSISLRDIIKQVEKAYLADAGILSNHSKERMSELLSLSQHELESMIQSHVH